MKIKRIKPKTLALVKDLCLLFQRLKKLFSRKVDLKFPGEFDTNYHVCIRLISEIEYYDYNTITFINNAGKIEDAINRMYKLSQSSDEKYLVHKIYARFKKCEVLTRYNNKKVN